jgi:hypothetical protein
MLFRLNKKDFWKEINNKNKKIEQVNEVLIKKGNAKEEVVFFRSSWWAPSGVCVRAA